MQPNQPDYSFILNNPQPPQKSGIPGAGSMLGRIVLVGVGLIILLILFVVVKGVLAGGGNKAQYVSVVQDQASILHILSDATQQEGISEKNKAFALTAQLDINSAKSSTLEYMSTNKMKVSTKDLQLKVSSQTDSQLSDAAANSNYNETFHDVMKSQLEAYQRDLQIAYKATTGPNGQKVLSSNFDRAELLLTKLEEQ